MRLTEEKKARNLENRALRLRRRHSPIPENSLDHLNHGEPVRVSAVEGYQGHGCSLNRCLDAGILNLMMLGGGLLGGGGAFVNGISILKR